MSLLLCSDLNVLSLALADQPAPLTWLAAGAAPVTLPEAAGTANVIAWQGHPLPTLEGTLVVALEAAALDAAQRTALRVPLRQHLAASRPVVLAPGALGVVAPEAGVAEAALIPATLVLLAPLPETLGPALLHEHGVRRLLVLSGSVVAEYAAARSLLSVRGPGSVFAATLSTTAQLATVPLSVHVLAGGTTLPW